MEARISDGFLSKARQIASRLSMLGRFAPRSIELICETLSFVAAARSFNDQSRSTRNSLIRVPAVRATGPAACGRG